MRSFNQYLFKDKFHIFPFFLKYRLLNFKRPKWKKLQSQMSYYFKQYFFLRKKFKNFFFFKFLSNLDFLKKKLKIVKKKKFFIRLKFLKFLRSLKYFLNSSKFLKNLYYYTSFKKNTYKYKYKYKYKFKFKPKNYKIKTSQFLFRFLFFNFKTLKKNYRIKIRSRFIFKNMLFMKYNIVKYFFGIISIKMFKNFAFRNLKLASYNDLISKLILKFDFRLDILLWRLKFFESPYLSRFFCKKGLITVNKKKSNLFSNFFFKKFLETNDFVSLNLKFSLKKNLKNYIRSFFLPTFFEIDYYSGSFVLLKNFNNLNYRDTNSFLKQPLCVYKFKDYLLK